MCLIPCLYQVQTDIRLIFESGVKKVVVVLSKMDESGVNWAEKRFNQIVEKMTKVLQVGVDETLRTSFIASRPTFPKMFP